MVECHQILDEAFCNQLRHRYSYGTDIGIPIRFQLVELFLVCRDIFGAPLAIEGLFAFFLEATFFAVMFFGWNRVSRRFHLVSTWMVFIGSNISALWILVANAWMQNPVGMEFNPMTARNEMSDFWAVLLLTDSHE